MRANCKFYVFCKYITYPGVGCFIIKFIVIRFANTDRLLTKQTHCFANGNRNIPLSVFVEMLWPQSYFFRFVAADYFRFKNAHFII